MESAGNESSRTRRVLIIVQNLPVPFDRRVWQEALTLQANGYQVSIICPKMKGYTLSHECIDGIHVYRHPLPLEAKGALGYALEYASSLAFEFYLACKVFVKHGFDVIHACNPPDTIFLIGGFFKCCFGTKFLFDHHDINPELYEAKFGRRGFFYYVILLLERLTFCTADVSIATNYSYRAIATQRGKMPEDKVFVVRSGPNLERMKIVPAVPQLKKGKKFLVGYVGVMGQQEGIHYLIQAARIIVHDFKRDDVHFALVGGGSALAQMQALAREMNVAEHITFTGRTLDEELLQVLNTADVCVNPDEVNTMNDKSTMNKIMEYMALGKPIVQFDVTEGRVSAGEASLYAKANDAEDFARKIVELLDDHNKRAEMGRIGRERIEKELAWPYEVPKLLAAYDTVFALPSWHHTFKWYYHRLRVMSPAEVLYRGLEAAKKKIDKHYMGMLVPAARDRGALPQIPGLRSGLDVWQLPAELSSQWEHWAQQVRGGVLNLLGQEWPRYTHYPDWHRDPVTGKLWPEHKYCFDIDYRHAADKGDVKYVWELGRLQYLQPLAALAYKRKDVELAKYCLNTIENWIDNNPPHKGVHWASGIELALRAVSIVFVTTCVGEHLTQPQRGKIWGTLEAHALWIERYPSRFSSANNHMAAEALGLFLTGTLCPNFSASLRWKTFGWKQLCKATRTLILGDGVGAEQAVAYTAFALEMLLLGYHVARAAQLTVPDYYMQQLVRGGECLRWVTDAGGNQPRIGDDDEGCVIGDGRYEGSYIGSVLGSIAAVSGRGDLNPPRNIPHLRQALFGAVSVASLAPQGVRNFEQGGYIVGRYKRKGQDVMLVMDHGNLGYLSIAAHGHADALALWLHVGDQPVLVDAGTYLFHSGGKERDFFRGTKAHNTLSIAGADSSVIAGSFNWSHKASAKLTASQYANEHWWVEAEHDGYMRDFNIIHRRRLNVSQPQGFSVEDSLIGGDAQSVEIGFVFHPSLAAVEREGRIDILRGSTVIVSLTHEGPLQSQLTTSGYSPSFGKKEFAPRVVFAGTLHPEQKAVTHFMLGA